MINYTTPEIHVGIRHCRCKCPRDLVMKMAVNTLHVCKSCRRERI